MRAKAWDFICLSDRVIYFLKSKAFYRGEKRKKGHSLVSTPVNALCIKKFKSDFGPVRGPFQSQL
jgi:hypothetical protein